MVAAYQPSKAAQPQEQHRWGHRLVLITEEQGQEEKNNQQYTKGGNPVGKVKSHQDAFSPTTDVRFSLHSLDYHVIKRQLT